MIKDKHIHSSLVSAASGFVGAFIFSVLFFGTLFFYGQNSGLLRNVNQTGFGAFAEQNNSVQNNNSVVNVAKEANPAVVAITISKKLTARDAYLYNSDPNYSIQDYLYEKLFGNDPQAPIKPNYPNDNSQSDIPKSDGTSQKYDVGGGSGFFVSSDGLILTNKHVVSDEDATYTVYTNDGESHIAKVMAIDPILDLAIIKIDPSKDNGKNGYPTLRFADSDTVEIGQTAIAIGNALGEFRNSLSVGVISGLGRSVIAGDEEGGVSETLNEVIQTDAAINPGNSGGPLLNVNGEVVGINVAIVGGSQNIGFALPSNNVRGVVESFQKTGKIVRPYLGIRYVQITPELKIKNKLSVDYGVLITRGATEGELAIIPGSPANKADLVENDIILDVNGKKLDSNTSLASIVALAHVGDTIMLKVLHQGEERTVSVVLEAIPQ